jgi:hypothetical protein
VTAFEVRRDLLDAQAAAWSSLGRAGSQWSAEQRLELATAALEAIVDPEPPPPWVRPSSVTGRVRAERVPADAHDVVHRVARHAGSLTRSWYDAQAVTLGPLAYVELVSIACIVAAVESFRRSAGLEPWVLPAVEPGDATGHVAGDLVMSPRTSWVPVAAPADVRAAVVQAFSALPESDRTVWALADAQYIPDREMVDPRWTRGTLTRPQMELVATRVADVRECFY